MPDTALSRTPDHCAHADSLISALDRCFVAGFARLGSAQKSTLLAWGRVFRGTPLGTAVADATAALSNSQVTEDHLVALACAREALQGARFDALVGHAHRALGIPAASPAASNDTASDDTASDDRPDGAASPSSISAEASTYMSSARKWLVEVALAGLGQLDVPTVVPFSATLEAMQAQPALFGLSALLTGFVDELVDHLPTAAMSELPARRWADLWARAMVGAWRSRPQPVSQAVSGELRVVGADLRHHDHLASLVAYGVLDGAGGAGQPARFVRATVSAWKVDAVSGDEVWTAFAGVPGAAHLLTAISERKSLIVSDMQLTRAGDLLFHGGTRLGEAFDPIATARAALAADSGVIAPGVPPLERHPAHIAIPLVVTGARYTAGKRKGGPGHIELSGESVAIAWHRVSPLAGMASLARTSDLFGLLRYDQGGWEFQPITAREKNGYLGVGASIARGLRIKKSASTLGILQERAGKLLRAR